MKDTSLKFSSYQIKFFIIIGAILGLRELSMTMLNPFMSLFGKELNHSTPLLCGIAMGIYGLSNCIFQIPYGNLSDKYGRKKIIIIGLIQLSLGLLIAFFTTNIYIFIFARFLQGSGAVMAIGYSWIGDTFNVKQINTAMVYTGTIVSLGAVGAFVLGPMLYLIMPLKYMFLCCFILILLCILGLIFFIKNNSTSVSDSDSDSNKITNDTINIKSVMTKPLIYLSICGFIFNYIMSSMFYIAPNYIDELIGASNMWKVMLPSVILGVISMKIASKYSDKGCFRQTASIAFIFLGLGFSLLLIKTITFIFIGVCLVFAGYMILTTGIPSMTNKLYSNNVRGSANGILQTLIFLGFFVGPTLTGFLIEIDHIVLIYCCSIVISLIGLIFIQKFSIITKEQISKITIEN